MPNAAFSQRQTLASLEAQWLAAQAFMVASHSTPELQMRETNTALRNSGANWLGLIDAGDQLAPDALFRIAHAVREHPQWQIVYTDEDQITADGQHTNPHCKPDFNLDYLRSLPYVGGLLLIRRDLFEALGGFDPQAEGAEDYDLMLRAWEHLQRTGAGEAALGHVPEVLYHRLQGSGHTQKSVPEILQAGHSALQRHFERLGIAAQVQPGPFPPSFRVRWPLPEARPLVSILIPTRDQLPLLQRCVESVIEKTKYPAYEILIIDNDSQTIDARNYLAAIEAKEAELGGRLRVVRQPGPFNFSAMNNAAARAARGDYLLLLNNDTAALHDDWLDEMMGHAVRPDVGIVGAKLLYPPGKIQHAGLTLGLLGVVGNPFIGRPPEDRGYFGRAQLTQDLSAVTGACLLVRKSVYEQVGGLDEQAFKVSYNDIDLCLKVREAGLRIVFTPYALLMHEGSASQKSGTETQPDNAKLKRFAAEKDAMYAKWLPQLAFDPAYNRHLSLASTDFLLDDQPCLSWDPDWRPRPRILVHPADREGCGEYRIIAPMRALNRAGLTQGWETMRLFEPAEMERMQPDSLVVQRQMEWPQIEALERHARTSKAFRVFEIDDLITNLPHKSVHKSTIHKDIAKRFRKAAGLCNRLVVATEPLAKAYAHFTDEVVVQPNYLEAARWGHLQPERAERSKPRVGWAGGVGHTGDLELIADLVRDTASEVDWVFFGLCPEALKPLVKEFHPGVPLDQYAARLAALDLDLAVAPLEDNAFNEAKSHLRLLEYGILGYPVICSDLTPYQGDFPVTRVANRYRDWTRALREAISDRAALRAQGDALRAKVLADWMMEDHLDTWLKAWLR
nr:glycosyltransferase [Thiomonas arsenitoxydans]